MLQTSNTNLFAIIRRPKNPRRSRRNRLNPAEKKQNADTLQVEGVIISVLAGTMFKVKLDNEHIVLAHISGKMRKRFIRLVVGDKVKMEISPYDLTKARITYRMS